MNQQSTSRIIVGLDGSANDDAVLGAAMTEATRRTATLKVVHAIQITMLDVETAGQNTSQRLTERSAHIEDVRIELRHQIDATAAALGFSVPIELQIERGDPATCLLGAARTADLIVAGTRGAGTGSPLLLGFVSQDIAVHAPCPVLLVPTNYEHGTLSTAI